VSRNATREKMLRDLADFEADNCEHATTKAIRDRMKVGRQSRGVPIPENFAEHFGCLRCVVLFIERKAAEGRREGYQNAIATLVAHTPAAEAEEPG
jgi:hypothetical protein